MFYSSHITFSMVLRKYFFYWLAAMTGIVLLYIVFGPKAKQIDLKSINFHSTESAELYFKNIRSFSYEREENSDAQFILYRIKSREKDTLVPTINFMIVSNWLQDENYIIVETQPEQLLDKGLMWVKDENEGVIKLKTRDAEAHYVFSALFYEQLTGESDFFYIDENGESRHLIFSEDQQKSLKKTLKDYYKLVGKIR